MDIDRGFVRIAEGLVHYRFCGSGGAAPLYMIHASPASSLGLQPLMAALGETRRVIAPDTLGNGDSAPPGPDAPDMDYYAGSVARVLDALGIDQADIYGSHTGAHIACELAIRHPDRVRRVIFDGVGLMSHETRADYLARYAPEMRPDDWGRHFTWAWNFIRDQTLYFPYFKTDPDRARGLPVPPAESIHGLAVEVLKSITTYHKGYRAAFRHPDRERLPLVNRPALVMANVDDPLHVSTDEAAALVPGSRKALLPSARTPQGMAATIEAITRFLDG